MQPLKHVNDSDMKTNEMHLSETLDGYKSRLDEFNLPDDFVQTIRIKMNEGMSFEPAFGQAFFEALENANLLEGFDHKYDPDIKLLIKGYIDVIEMKYLKGRKAKVVGDGFINKCLNENIGMILVGLRNLLRSLYMRNADRRILDVVSKERDDVRSSVDSIIKAAGTDSLMDIGNRAAYTEHIQSLQNKPIAPIALLIFDADHFKSVNDTYGHDAGDIVLKDFATVIAKHTSADTVFRYGGEEIVVVLELGNGWDEDQVIKMADDVRKKFSEINFKDRFEVSDDVRRTCSVGVAFGKNSDLAGNGGGKIFKKADALMYESKGGGRNKTSVGRVSEINRV